MEWTEVIQEAICFIEEHIIEDITIYDVAEHVHVSEFYFQKGFRLLCGYSVMEYIRNRRLSLAGQELLTNDCSIIELAGKYGYDSPDSFTKAFARFHGNTPSIVRRNRGTVKDFAPLKLTISLKGGYTLDYRIEKKESFTVLGVSKEFCYTDAKQEIPLFWQEHFSSENGKTVCGMYGINIDPGMGNGRFEYLIADPFHPPADIPEGLAVRTIPEFTWAIFPCKGALTQSMQTVNTQIFSQWLPAQRDYAFAAGYCVELYDAADKYPDGTNDQNYYSEIWIPIKKKQ